MSEPKGTVTITEDEMHDVTSVNNMLLLFQFRGMPLHRDKGLKLEPHPDYVYTEHVDYDAHTITITWELRQ